jgi:predicted transcriptional regulator
MNIRDAIYSPSPAAPAPTATEQTEAKREKCRDVILRVFTPGKEMTSATVIAATGLRKQTVGNYLEKLRVDGLLARRRVTDTRLRNVGVWAYTKISKQ